MSWQCQLVSRETRIQSHGGVEGQMGRSGGARETWLQTRSTASGTATKQNPVQESLWNYLPTTTTMPTPPIKTAPKPTSQTTSIPTHLLTFLLITPLPRSPPYPFQPWCLAQHIPSPGMFSLGARVFYIDDSLDQCCKYLYLIVLHKL